MSCCIKEEIQAAQTALKQEWSQRLDRIEDQLKQLAEVGQTVSQVEDAIQFQSQRIDDLLKVTLPAITDYVEKMVNASVIQTLDLDAHRRKWSISIHGLPGPAGEDEATTRKACVALAQQHLRVPDAAEADIAACHRLKQEPNAGITIRFVDLSKRNKWMAGAKHLKGHDGKISMTPDMPPPLRKLRTELLAIRRNMPPEQKTQTSIKYLKTWPYVELSVPGGDNIRPTTSQSDVVANILGIHPRLSLAELSGDITEDA